MMSSVSSNDHQIAPPLLVDSPAPTRGSERIVGVDVLRGFAVLGLMLVHVVVFSQPINPLGDLRGGIEYADANRVFLWINNVLVFGKFMFLFALLFGASVMFFDRKTGNGSLSTGVVLWYRRMAWLAAIGFLHGIFLFFGDILFLYAVCGMGVLWYVRRLSPGAILGMAAGFYLFGTSCFGGMMWMTYALAGQMDMSQMTAHQIEAFTGSYFDAVRFTAQLYLTNTLLMIPFVTFWITTAVMLLGMALAKLGVLTGRRSARFYALLAAVGLGIGVPLSAGLFHWVTIGDFSLGRTYTYVSLFSTLAIPTSLGYLGVVMLIVKLNILRPVQHALAAVGRMALSNYLLHSVCGAVIFQGWGFGLFQELEYPELLYIVLGVWAINITFSMIWLRIFRFGPVEWLWRTLTYFRWQPLLRGGGQGRSET